MAQPVMQQLEEADSTQDVLHSLAAGGAPTGSAVVARVQHGGRGRRGSAWASPPGGLWLSVLCRPPADAAPDLLSLRVGLAVAGALEAWRPELQVRLKWPNDLMLDSRKLGGILCEARWQGGTVGWVAVGIGLNVSNPIPEDLATRAISLATVVPEGRPEDLQEPVIGAVRAAGERGGALTATELAEWAARDWLLGRRLAAPVAGVAAGLAPDGALRVTTTSGETTLVRAGSIELDSTPGGLPQARVAGP